MNTLFAYSLSPSSALGSLGLLLALGFALLGFLLSLGGGLSGDVRLAEGGRRSEAQLLGFGVVVHRTRFHQTA